MSAMRSVDPFVTRPAMTGICAFPSSAAASSERLEALQSRSLALVSPPLNVMETVSAEVRA